MSSGAPFDSILPGVVLFRLSFNVLTSTSNDFYSFIEQVDQELRRHIERPRYFGTGTTTMLPRPRDPPSWFVIVLESRDRESSHSVSLFIEAETMYLRGYQNEHNDVFEFKQPKGGKSYLKKSSKTKALSFSCNYIDISACTRRKGPDGSLSRDDIKLETADYGHDRLRRAVVDLAQGRNPVGQSQDLTAESLLLVIVRFCESIRFLSVRRAMRDLWNRPGSLSSHCVGQIQNWDAIGSNLVESDRYGGCKPVRWSDGLQRKTGVYTVADARDKLAFILFHIKQDKDIKKKDDEPDPDKDNPPEWDYCNRRQGGPGPGPAGGGAFGVPGALADDELPPLYAMMPEEPVLEILRSFPTGPRRSHMYGSITVTDGFGAQTINLVSRDIYHSADMDIILDMDAQKRAIPAYDCVDIDIDLYEASNHARLATGHMSWNMCNFQANLYDQTVIWDISEVLALEYIVYSKAVEVEVNVTVDTGGDADTRGWFTTHNTMVGDWVAKRFPMQAVQVPPDDFTNLLLRGDHVAAVPLGYKLVVTVSLEPDGSLQTFELELINEEGTFTTTTKQLQQGKTAKVNFAWNLLRKEPPEPIISSDDSTNNREMNYK